jgi:hypothetical protein
MVGPEDYIATASGTFVGGIWACLPDGNWSNTQVGIGGECTNGDRCYQSFCANGKCSISCNNYSGYGCSNNGYDYTDPAAGTCTGSLAAAQCTQAGGTSMDCGATGTIDCQAGIDATSISCIGGDSCDSDAGGPFSQTGVCSSNSTCWSSDFLCLRGTTYHHSSPGVSSSCLNGDFCDDSLGAGTGDFAAGAKRYDADDKTCEDCVNSQGDDNLCESACGADALADERSIGYIQNNKGAAAAMGCPADSTCLVASSPACQAYDGDGLLSVCTSLPGSYTWTTVSTGDRVVDSAGCSLNVTCGDGNPANGFCCGDDANEKYRTCNAGVGFPDAGSCGAGNAACCSSATACVTPTGNCVAPGTSLDADGDGDTDYCDLTGGTWRDCSTDANCPSDSYCSAGNCVTLDSPTMLESIVSCGDGGPCGGKGRINLSWSPVIGANGYTLWIFNGRFYEAHDIDNVVAWNSDDHNWWPTNAQIDAWAAGGWVGNIFCDNSSYCPDNGGSELVEDPNYLYYKAGDPIYMSRHFYYWLHLSSYGADGRTSGTPGAGATWLGGENMPDCSCYADGDQCHPLIGHQAENDRYCKSGSVCDNDGVGLADGGWCFTPIDTFGHCSGGNCQDNNGATCEFRTGNAWLFADERAPGFKQDNRGSASNYMGCPAGSYCYVEGSITCAAYDGDYNLNTCPSTSGTWMTVANGDRMVDSVDCTNGGAGPIVNCGDGNTADGFCCGDDSGEYLRTETGSTDAPAGFNDGTPACCDSSTDSVYNGACIAQGATSGSVPNRAWTTGGTWYGGDYSATACAAITGSGSTWLASATGANSKCCGDDTTSDDFGQTPAADRGVCADGVIRADATTFNTNFLVSDGQLFSCNAANIYSFDNDRSMCGGPVEGLYCQSGGSWAATKELGCACSGYGYSSECASNICCGYPTSYCISDAVGSLEEDAACCNIDSLCSDDNGYAHDCSTGLCKREFGQGCYDDSQCASGNCDGGYCENPVTETYCDSSPYNGAYCSGWEYLVSGVGSYYECAPYCGAAGMTCCFWDANSHACYGGGTRQWEGNSDYYAGDCYY